MNRFMVERTPALCAQALCDVHLRKMIVEEAQMLSTAHWMASKESDIPDNIYKLAYANHPCSKWVRESRVHYNFAWKLLANMVAEYEYRFDKLHATTALVYRLKPIPTYTKSKSVSIPHPMCMPEQYRLYTWDEQPLVFESYRGYYAAKLKRWLKSGNTDVTYTNREVPAWLQEGLS